MDIDCFLEIHVNVNATIIKVFFVSYVSKMQLL